MARWPELRRDGAHRRGDRPRLDLGRRPPPVPRRRAAAARARGRRGPCSPPSPRSPSASQLGPLVAVHQLPQPRHARQAGRHRGRDQRRTADPGPRRRLERGRVPGLRLPVRPSGQPLRGGVHDHPHPARATGRCDFHGTYYELADCELLPRGPRHALGEGPPLMVGSMGERMLAITLPWVQAWNAWFTWFGNTLEGYRPLRDDGRRRVPRRGPRPGGGGAHRWRCWSPSPAPRAARWAT